jgi:cobalt/nickel transport system permease protein
VLAIITGGVLSWFASTHPDGLDWSIEKITGRGGLPEARQGIAPVLKGIQEKTAFLSDYTFTSPGNEPKKGEAAPARPRIDAGTSTAGIVGAAIVLGMILLIGVGIRSFRGRSS